jgi:hypothetical protein
VALNPPSPLRVRPLPVGLASVGAVAVFVVVLAIVARQTADGVVMPRPDAGPEPDAGLLDGGVDAGVVELVTVEPGPDAGPEPDGGPPTVEPPPYDPAVVAAAAVVIVEGCVKDALRWDPSLGGAFTLRVLLPVTPLTTSERELEEPGDADDDGPPPLLQTPGLVSPVLEACLQRRAIDMARAPGTRDLTAPQAVVARAVLHAGGTVDIADAVVVAAPSPPRARPAR